MNVMDYARLIRAMLAKGGSSRLAPHRVAISACAGALILLAACDLGYSATPQASTPSSPVLSATPPIPSQVSPTEAAVVPDTPTLLPSVEVPASSKLTVFGSTAPTAQPQRTQSAQSVQVHPPGAEATARVAPSASATPLRGPTSTRLLPHSTPPPTLTAPKVTSQAVSRAIYVFPVQPASSASYGPYHHDYPATDIFCPVGSHFVAPTGGVVDYVTRVDTWDPATDNPAVRGGLSVAIIGDDGIRYYGSHLSRVSDGIAPGVRVTAGQLLGLTGKTGDARFTAPHLHFGISPPTTPTDWKVRRGVVSPYKYLRAWAAGTQLKPVLK